jgi:hypothetical protein
MRYFSIDYRSPPSGMGQIIDTTKPEKIGDRYNYILITYSGCGSENDPTYNLTKHFPSKQAEEEGWAGPIMTDIIQFLRDQQVTHVYDSELSYNYEGGNENDFNGLFTLDRWEEIMMSYL